MATHEQINRAKQRMEQAEAALRKYTERDATQPTDIKLHGRLADELRKANDEYLRLLGEKEN